MFSLVKAHWAIILWSVDCLRTELALKHLYWRGSQWLNFRTINSLSYSGAGWLPHEITLWILSLYIIVKFNARW